MYGLTIVARGKYQSLETKPYLVNLKRRKADWLGKVLLNPDSKRVVWSLTASMILPEYARYFPERVLFDEDDLLV